jgi:threonine aldolase
MAEAEVGDDEYGEDPTVNLLQETFAEMMGKDAALFVPSGTMANQIAIRCLTRPGDAVVAGRRQHVVVYEAGAAGINAGITFLTVSDETGALAQADVKLIIDSAAHHQPPVALVALEDTHMAAGGSVWKLSDMTSLAELTRSRGVALHLDGARLWNAAIASGHPLAERAEPATTVMCCLSKGLGAPVGSVLAGPADLVELAKLHRKRLGGAMRQAGVIAAAGLVALRRGLERLADDHARAKRIAGAVAERWPGSIELSSVETNIVTFSHPDPAGLIAHLAGDGILAGTIAPGVVRMVTHVDVDDDGAERACQSLAKAP